MKKTVFKNATVIFQLIQIKEKNPVAVIFSQSII